MRDLEEQQGGFADFASDSDGEDLPETEEDRELQLALFVIPEQESAIVSRAEQAALQLFPPSGKSRGPRRQHKQDLASFSKGKEVAKKRNLMGEPVAIQ